MFPDKFTFLKVSQLYSDLVMEAMIDIQFHVHVQPTPSPVLQCVLVHHHHDTWQHLQSLNQWVYMILQNNSVVLGRDLPIKHK